MKTLQRYLSLLRKEKIDDEVYTLGKIFNLDESGILEADTLKHRHFGGESMSLRV